MELTSRSNFESGLNFWWFWIFLLTKSMARVSLKMVNSFIRDKNLCFYCMKMVWYYAGSLEQESMTSSLMREFTTVLVVGHLSTGP